MAALPSLLCRVQALYPFESSDPSSLCFEQGDYIDVLSKLPSGWWDGWRNGNRGWFPSNYVKIIEDYTGCSGGGVVHGSTGLVSPTHSNHRNTTINKRISGINDLFDDRIGTPVQQQRERQLPPNWSIQVNSDGSTSYYFNTITGEMRSTYPYENFNQQQNGSIDDEDSINDDSDDDDEEESVTSTVDSSSKTTEGATSTDDVSLDQTNSGGKWIQRTTPQGLPFFYNLSTQETAWHADSQENQHNLTQQPKMFSSASPFSLQQQQQQQNNQMTTNELTWNKLLVHVTYTINELIDSAKNAQRSLYKKYASLVVDAVRFMLVASGTINKESMYIKTNGILRSHHRAMMASMSKLVLSSQLCADGTVTDVTKLLSDCHELMVAVRNFTGTCENVPVPVNHVDPFLLLNHAELDGQQQRRQNSSIGSTTQFTTTTGTTATTAVHEGIRAKYELQADLIENLDIYGLSMQESMESLMANLTRHSDSRCSLAVLLFTQYRNFGNQNGQFLSIIEDIDFDGVIRSPLMKDLAMAKQKLYDGLGLLFYKLQTMTDETIPMDQVIREMQHAAQSIIDAIRLVCDHMADLVQERNLASHRSSGLMSSSLSSDGKGASSFSDFLKDAATSIDLSLGGNNGSSTTLSATNKRSHSLSMEKTSAGNLSASNSSSKLSNRSSAPITDNSSSLLCIEHSNNNSTTALTMKHRSHTLTDAQSKHTSAKLKQFFGDDVPASDQPPVSPMNSSFDDTTGTLTRTNTTSPQPANNNGTDPNAAMHTDEQRFLQYDYAPNEIVFTVDGYVKGGTLRALVERMTLHDYLDMNFNNTFLLTYRSFCTSMELLELLEARYNIQPPEDLMVNELEVWITKKQKLIRLRVFNVLKIWLEQYYYEEDSVILDRLLFFTNTSIKDTLNFSAYQLERLIHKRKEACKDMKKLVITQPMDSPDPILPRNLKKFRLLDLDATEMARQLTIMDFKLYSSIKPVECLDKAWSRESKYPNDARTPVARNIQASIDYCNQVTTWVSDEILSQPEVKKRSTLIKYWVNVAERCRMFNNFNTCMAILSAFDNSAVGRLKRTWEMVGARTNHIVSHIRKLMGANRNFNQYRALIHSVNPPCIPFLGIYLQDLTFIEDGNPNFLKTSKDLINFAKRAKTAEVIREIQQYQSMGYTFRPVEEIQNFVMENMHSSRDEDQLYKESLKLEPKERDDEKITRLLQESGFL